MDRWKPSVTVAAVVERDGRLLMVEEHTPDGLRLNQPAGHLDPGESLAAAAARETLEETGWIVEPVALLGVYLARYANARTGTDVAYLRHAFVCRAVAHDARRVLDDGIVCALWMTPAEIDAARARHRSPLVGRTVDDWLAGRRFPLDAIRTDPSALAGADASR